MIILQNMSLLVIPHLGLFQNYSPYFRPVSEKDGHERGDVGELGYLLEQGNLLCIAFCFLSVKYRRRFMKLCEVDESLR